MRTSIWPIGSKVFLREVGICGQRGRGEGVSASEVPVSGMTTGTSTTIKAEGQATRASSGKVEVCLPV